MGICPFKTCWGRQEPYPVWTRCGVCLECRKMNQSGKVLQMLLEETGSMHSQFLTFTFDPIHEANPEFDIKHPSYWQNMLKKLRRDHPPPLGHKLKYFRVGEHGDKNGRWHYHFVFFHLPHDVTTEEWEKVWKMGFVKTLPVNEATMNYVAKYTSVLKYHDKHEKYDPLNYTEHSCSNGLGQDAIRQYAETLYKAGHTLRDSPTPKNPHGTGREQRPNSISLDGVNYIPTRTLMNKFVEHFEELQGYKIPVDEWYDFNKALYDRRNELDTIDDIRINYNHKLRKHKLETQNGVYTAAEKAPPSETFASNPYLSEEAKDKIHTTPSLQDIWSTNPDPTRIDNSS